MKNIIFLVFILLISGCKTSFLTNITDGTFIYKYQDSNTNELILNKDSTFKLTFHIGVFGEGCESTCNGYWKYIAKDTIFIKCNPVPWTETITRCYMSDREYKIKVLTDNNLKMPITNNLKTKYVIFGKKS